MDIALEDGSAFKLDGWKYISEAFPNNTLHFIGLLSDGGVHSRYNQLIGFVQGAAKDGAKRIRVHILTVSACKHSLGSMHCASPIVLLPAQTHSPIPAPPLAAQSYCHLVLKLKRRHCSAPPPGQKLSAAAIHEAERTRVDTHTVSACASDCACPCLQAECGTCWEGIAVPPALHRSLCTLST